MSCGVRPIMKPQRQQQQIWAIIFSSGVFLAMVLADALKSADVPPVYVVFVSVVLAVGLGLIVALELVVEHLARPKR